jgi:hypothetical protein
MKRFWLLAALPVNQSVNHGFKNVSSLLPINGMDFLEQYQFLDLLSFL